MSMIGIKVQKQYAEKVKKYLIKRTLLDNKHKVIGKNSFIYFPIKKMNRNTFVFLEKNFDVKIIKTEFEKQGSFESYRELLKKKLGNEYEKTPRGFEIIGNIAVVDAEPKIAKELSSTIMKVNKNITTVVRKTSAVKGRYRKRGYGYVAGKRTYMARYKENGALLSFDIRDAFFSTKLSFERNRIASLSKGNEKIMVMFAGIGPFAIEIALKNKNAEIIAVELNRKAVACMKENIKINKTYNVTAVGGDVNVVSEKYKAFADRIIMPLPKDSGSFLESVDTVARKKCIVEYYSFVEIDGGVEKLEKKLSEFFSRKGRAFKVIMWRVVRPYSPKIFEIVMEFEINRKKLV